MTRKQKKSKSKLKTNKKLKTKINKLSGGGEVSFDVFNNLPSQIKIQINNAILSNLEMEMSVNQIQSRYKTQQQYQLYDFIFDTKTKQLSKIWDHETNNPMSITAGLPGIHIYVVKTNDNKHNFMIIGKITKK